MTINLIGLDTVKTNLGITDGSLDAELTALIPIVSTDVRRILNCQFSDTYPADVTSGDSTLSAIQGLCLGQVLQNPDLPVDTYIVSYDWDNSTYELSANATDTIEWVNPTITIGQQAAISKMIYYKYSKQNISDVNKKNLVSESIGTYSATFADNEINSQWNYPQILIDDLGTSFAEVG